MIDISYEKCTEFSLEEMGLNNNEFQYHELIVKSYYMSHDDMRAAIAPLRLF